ncbi:MAG: hypothetical protein GX649_10230 [Chloroflexi bacterium]|nr:hypothetical protein [Chloroflexota bacterium]
MNHLERFQALMSFQPVDRLPRIEWAPWWDQTIARWRGEGLPARLKSHFDVREYLGLDPYHQVWSRPRASGFPAMPHGQGPVATEADYEALLPHLYPPQGEHLDELAAWGRRQARGEVVVWLSLEGFFWYPRTLFGIQPHLTAFYDLPDLMQRMNRDLAEYHVRYLNEVRKVCCPAFMTFAEDMSYNKGPMLSRALFEEFIAPHYRRVVPVLQEMGTRVIVDTDGDPSLMIDWLEGVGVEGVLPLERQAGVDAARLRADHPRLLMLGHYDKMVMDRGVEAIRKEFERLRPVVRTGGYLPGVDHQTPPGVSLAQYREYLEVQREFSVSAVG